MNWARASTPIFEGKQIQQISDEQGKMFRDAQGTWVLSGDGSYKFRAVIDGRDLVVRDVKATWFGGDDDPDDDGFTASWRDDQG